MHVCVRVCLQRSVTVAVLVAAIAALGPACSGCTHSVLSRTPSPDGRFVATVERSLCDGGATGGSTVTDVFLRQTASAATPAPQSAGAAVTLLSLDRASSEVALAWDGPTRLLVDYRAAEGDVFVKGPASWNGINVVYGRS